MWSQSRFKVINGFFLRGGEGSISGCQICTEQISGLQSIYQCTDYCSSDDRCVAYGILDEGLESELIHCSLIKNNLITSRHVDMQTNFSLFVKKQFHDQAFIMGNVSGKSSSMHEIEKSVSLRLFFQNVLPTRLAKVGLRLETHCTGWEIKSVT